MKLLHFEKSVINMTPHLSFAMGSDVAVVLASIRQSQIADLQRACSENTKYIPLTKRKFPCYFIKSRAHLFNLHPLASRVLYFLLLRRTISMEILVLKFFPENTRNIARKENKARNLAIFLFKSSLKLFWRKNVSKYCKVLLRNFLIFVERYLFWPLASSLEMVCPEWVALDDPPYVCSLQPWLQYWELLMYLLIN